MANVVTLASNSSDVQGFIDALAPYAVPKYFNKIEEEKGSTGYVICYCDDVPFLKIPVELRGYSSNAIYAYIGEEWSTLRQSTSSVSGLFKLIVTVNALLIVARTDSSSSQLRGDAALPLLIAKDNNGKTAFYTQKTYVSTASTVPSTVQAFSDGDAAILDFGTSYNKTDSAAGITGLIPIYTNGGYLENVWLSFISQFAPGIFSMTLSGKKYFQYESAVILDE